MASLMSRLTSRETEIFLLIGQGLSAAQIAQKLSLHIRTIDTYLDRIREKLDIDTAAGDLERHAIRWLQRCANGCGGQD